MGGRCSPEKKRAAAKRYAERHPDRIVERRKRYLAANPEYILKWRKLGQKAARAKNPERYHAYWHVWKAVKTGKLVKLPFCEICLQSQSGPQGIEAHHYLGYSKENRLNVVWLCSFCHRAVEGKRNNWMRAA